MTEIIPKLEYVTIKRSEYDYLRAVVDGGPKPISTGRIMLEMADADREQQMWKRRFQVLYHAHPIWRTADNDGSWGLRDFLAYAGQICGFTFPPDEAVTPSNQP